MRVGQKDLPIPDADDIRLAGILRALSDPGRLRMLMVLADGLYHPCKPEAFGLDLQKSTLSHHLKTMREAGLTITRVQGRTYDVVLRVEELEHRFPGLIAALTSNAARADFENDDVSAIIK